MTCENMPVIMNLPAGFRLYCYSDRSLFEPSVASVCPDGVWTMGSIGYEKLKTHDCVVVACSRVTGNLFSHRCWRHFRHDLLVHVADKQGPDN